MSEARSPSFHMEVDGGGDAAGAPGWHVLRLVGELDLVHAEAVQHALVAMAGSDVLVDMSTLEFVDSQGLSALLVARRRIEEAGHSLRLRGASDATRRVFEAAGLADVLDD